MPSLTLLLSLIAPNLPTTAVLWITTLVPAIVELVRGLKLGTDVSGSEKKVAAVQAVRAMIDEHLDWLPKWKKLSEARKDRILDGAVELALFIIELEEEGVDTKTPLIDMKKVFAKLRKK